MQNQRAQRNLEHHCVEVKVSCSFLVSLSLSQVMSVNNIVKTQNFVAA